MWMPTASSGRRGAMFHPGRVRTPFGFVEVDPARPRQLGVTCVERRELLLDGDRVSPVEGGITSPPSRGSGLGRLGAGERRTMRFSATSTVSAFGKRQVAPVAGWRQRRSGGPRSRFGSIVAELRGDRDVMSGIAAPSHSSASTASRRAEFQAIRFDHAPRNCAVCRRGFIGRPDRPEVDPLCCAQRRQTHAGRGGGRCGRFGVIRTDPIECGLGSLCRLIEALLGRSPGRLLHLTSWSRDGRRLRRPCIRSQTSTTWSSTDSISAPVQDRTRWPWRSFPRRCGRALRLPACRRAGSPEVRRLAADGFGFEKT